ncbi:MAG: SPOR domain-containing protein [Proteobacteria bacterium]|nr:SPOR domain-containing protein [Pseudomonadota bacterium]
MPIQIASWVADGISYITTDKTVADHGISLVANRDCALFRSLTEGDICRDDDISTMVADSTKGAGNRQAMIRTAAEGAAPQPQAVDALPSFPNALDGAEQLANFQTAAGNSAQRLPETPELTTDTASLDQLMAEAIAEMARKQVPVAKPAIKTKAPIEQASVSGAPLPGLYLVIGSFRDYVNARTLRAQHGTLTPQVLAAKVSSDTVFRVVVGPFHMIDGNRVKSEVRAAGIQDTWSIKVEPKDWRLAQHLEATAVQLANSGAAKHIEVAALPR